MLKIKKLYKITSNNRFGLRFFVNKSPKKIQNFKEFKNEQIVLVLKEDLIYYDLLWNNRIISVEKNFLFCGKNSVFSQM